MNKYSIITTIAIIVIITPFAFAAMNIVGSQQLGIQMAFSRNFHFYNIKSREMEFSKHTSILDDI